MDMHKELAEAQNDLTQILFDGGLVLKQNGAVYELYKVCNVPIHTGMTSILTFAIAMSRYYRKKYEAKNGNL